MSKSNTICPDPFEFHGGPEGVLLLHGFTGTPFEMRFLGERLHAEGYSVKAPLLAGHGDTIESLQSTRPTDWLNSALSAFEELSSRCDRVAVVGFSLGGLLAIELAERHPERTAAVILMGTPYILTGKLGALLLLYNFTPMVWFKPCFPKLGDHTEICDPSWKGRNPGHDRLPMRSGRHISRYLRRVRRKVPGIRCPSLVIHGERDDTVTAWGARLMARKLGSQTVWQLYLPQSAHLVTLDFDRQRLEDCVSNFLRQVL